MKPSERICTYPRMGKKPTKLIRDFLESLDLNTIPPPPTTDKTIKLGARHCANMTCLPLKITLGNYIEALDRGANTLLSYDTQGLCRFRMYNKLHSFTLTSLGYDFEMIVLNPRNIVSELKKVSGKSRLKIAKELWGGYKSLKQADKKVQQWSEEKPNIGIIGELYCCIDEKANQGIEEKIKKYGCNTVSTATTTEFMDEKIPMFSLWGLSNLFRTDELKPFKKEAKKYMEGWKAGHAYENLYNLLYLADRKVDGILHVLPLSCMPETTIEPYINDICRKNKIPLLRIPLDENSAEKNLETRLEVFTEMIIDKKRRGI